MSLLKTAVKASEYLLYPDIFTHVNFKCYQNVLFFSIVDKCLIRNKLWMELKNTVFSLQ